MPKGYDPEPPKGWKRPPINPVVKAIMDGKSHIIVDSSPLFTAPKEVDPKDDAPVLVGLWASLGSKRGYVIKKVKLPLQKAIERARTLSDISKELMSAVRKIPVINKENVSFLNSRILIDKRGLLRQYHTNLGRQKLLDSAFSLDIFEYEHDGYYAFIQDWFLIEMAMELARGNYIPRFNKFPIQDKECWAGPDLPDVEAIRRQMKEALQDV